MEERKKSHTEVTGRSGEVTWLSIKVLVAAVIILFILAPKYFTEQHKITLKGHTRSEVTHRSGQVMSEVTSLTTETCGNSINFYANIVSSFLRENDK